MKHYLSSSQKSADCPVKFKKKPCAYPGCSALVTGRYCGEHARKVNSDYEKFSSMKQAQGITGRLKEENTLEWTGRMNNIRACAREIVNEEIIFA